MVGNDDVAYVASANGNTPREYMIDAESRPIRHTREIRMEASGERIGEVLGLLAQSLCDRPDGHAFVSDIQITGQDRRHGILSCNIVSYSLRILPYLQCLQTIIGDMEMCRQKPESAFIRLNSRGQEWEIELPGIGIALILRTV